MRIAGPPLGKYNDPKRALLRAPQAMTEDIRQSKRLCRHLLSAVRLELNHTRPPRASVKPLHGLAQALHCSVLQNAEILNCSKTCEEQDPCRNTTDSLPLHMLWYPRLVRKKKMRKKRENWGFLGKFPQKEVFRELQKKVSLGKKSHRCYYYVKQKKKGKTGKSWLRKEGAMGKQQAMF